MDKFFLPRNVVLKINRSIPIYTIIILWMILSLYLQAVNCLMLATFLGYKPYEMRKECLIKYHVNPQSQV